MNIRLTPLLLATTALVCAATAADWNHYRGSNVDGYSPDAVNVKWLASGPKVVWKTATGSGFSSFVVAQGKAFIQLVRDVNGAPREVVAAFDANTGKELWATDVAVGKFDGSGNAGTQENNGGDGPRSTCASANGKVFVYTPSMELVCLDAASGKRLWSKDIAKDFGGRNIGWKSALAPVTDGDLVFVAGGGAGQSLLAFKQADGEVAWKVEDEKMTHATPTPATIHGVRQVIFFMQSGLVSVQAKDGKLLWKFPFRYNVSTAASAVVGGDIVYCSAGYGVGGGACKIVKNGAEFTAQELWKTPGDKDVANHWSTPVYKDGHLYGMFSFKKYGVGPLKCVEIATGKVKWEKPGFGAGQAIIAGNQVLALADDGQLVAVEATPEAYKEVARAKVVAGKCWSTPSLSNGRLYIRSTKEGVCLDVKP
jgi:outer membrane protein assembly factor BamB